MPLPLPLMSASAAACTARSSQVCAPWPKLTRRRHANPSAGSHRAAAWGCAVSCRPQMQGQGPVEHVRRRVHRFLEVASIANMKAPRKALTQPVVKKARLPELPLLVSLSPADALVLGQVDPLDT